MAAKRQLLLELLAKDGTGPATRGAAENLDNVAVSAEEAAKATDHLGHQAEESTEGVERFGKSNRTAAEHSEKLKHEIEALERELQGLAIEFAEAETAADKADFSKAIRKSQSDLRKLNGSKGLIDDLIPDGPEVGKFTDRLKQSFEDVAAAAPQIIAGGVAAAAPLAGALLSAGIIGGVGLGGIVGGFVIASKDPRVHSALDTLKTQIGAELKDAATPFVQVSLDGIKEIGSAVKAVDFKDIFADSAKNAAPVIAGIDQAIRGLGDGVQALVGRGGPVIAAIGDSVGNLGEHAGEFLDTVSHGSQGAADSVRDLTSALDTVLDVTGPVLVGLSDIYEVAHKFGAVEQFFTGLLGPLGQFADLLSKTGVFGDKAAGSLTLVKQGTDGVAASTPPATEAIVTFTSALDAAASAGQGLYGSTTNVADAEAALEKAVKTNGKTLDLNTQKGRNNRTALLGVASALTNNYDNFVKVNGEGAKSAQVANNNRAKFIQFAEALGRSKGQAEALATQLGLLPRNVSINVHYSVTGREALSADGHRIGYKAAGGPVKKGHAYVVGEKRPELFVPDRDGTIIPSLDQMSGSGASSGGGSGGGGGPAVVVIDVRGAESDLKRLIRKWIRTDNLLNG